jgi:predicted ATPase
MGPLRGRDGERAELGRLVASAAGGAGGVVVVVGAAGIGESRLLVEAVQIADGQGLQVAAGVADELEQVTPWAPLLRALSSTDPVVLSEDDLAPVRGLLDQLLSQLGAPCNPRGHNLRRSCPSRHGDQRARGMITGTVDLAREGY